MKEIKYYRCKNPALNANYYTIGDYIIPATNSGRPRAVIGYTDAVKCDYKDGLYWINTADAHTLLVPISELQKRRNTGIWFDLYDPAFINFESDIDE